jgi:hypothetical protein
LKNMKKNWNQWLYFSCCFEYVLSMNQAFRCFSMLECRLA